MMPMKTSSGTKPRKEDRESVILEITKDMWTLLITRETLELGVGGDP